ncbi:IPT/TIG domain-containing protein [Salinispora mooreana]|uniref:IPT/TIG domain-containing protein n=1 Tax=Salinispora mooreana TaxID=999545 RepID=UPI000364CCDB|nr:IPT/TIG domain-containing protein [Salinispora mooreana]
MNPSSIADTTFPIIRHRPSWTVLTLVAALAVVLPLGLPSDLPVPEPAAVTCDSVGYSYDAAGRLVGVQDRANESARYAYDEVGNALGVTNEGTADLAVHAIVPVRARVGETVTVQGGCFAPDPDDNVVFVGGVLAEVRQAGARRLVVEVPAGAGTGPVSVRVGDATATSPGVLTVDDGSDAPVIEAISSTLVAAGEAVTVTGSGFAPDPVGNKVTLNRSRALLGSGSADAVTLEVPTGAGSGRIRVETEHGSDVSPPERGPK